jgi:hypothetical protein
VVQAPVLGPAVTADVEELLRVEREANLPALHDVSPPYPDEIELRAP